MVWFVSRTIHIIGPAGPVFTKPINQPIIWTSYGLQIRQIIVHFDYFDELFAMLNFILAFEVVL